MRKLSAILLICLFAFSQYARQLSYLECKFSNSFKSNTAKCDCEKQAGFDKEDDNKSTPAKTHTHFHPDEFFSVTKGIIVNTCFIKPAILFVHLPGDDACEGNCPNPWQPPNA